MGYLRVWSVLAFDFGIMYYFAGPQLEVFATFLILVLYTFFIGEWLEVRVIKQAIPQCGQLNSSLAIE